MLHTLLDNLAEHHEVMKGVAFLEHDLDYLVDRMKRSIHGSGKIMIAGNGGSAADAQHFAAELVGCFEVKNRPALPAIALTTDTSILTSLGNDFGFDSIFSRQIEALAQPGDLFIGISTSGSSPNILKAIESAQQLKLETWALSGKGGGQLNAQLCERNLVVPSQNTARVQEAHTFMIHYICQQLDQNYDVRSRGV